MSLSDIKSKNKEMISDSTARIANIINKQVKDVNVQNLVLNEVILISKCLEAI